MSRCVEALDRRFYPGIANNWDDQLFRERILRYVDTSSAILDVGAGAGIVEQMNFRGRVAKVSGVDLDPRVLENPFLDDAQVATGENLPFGEESFDVVISDNVFEHLEDPAAVLQEISRVLRPGGFLLFKTPNRRHYMPLIARLTPHRFHAFVNRRRGRRVEDTFPTRYRANTRRDVSRIAVESGLRVARIEFIEGRPEYMRILCPLYLLGITYERLVNAFGFLAGLRIVMIAVLQKPGETTAAM